MHFGIQWLSLALIEAQIVFGSPAPLGQRDLFTRDNSTSLVAQLLDTAQNLTDTQSASAVSNLKAVIQSAAPKIENAAPVSRKRDESQRAQTACFVLSILFPSGYVDSRSANYTAETDVNWSTACWLPAACFVSPNNAAEVAITLKVITFLGSKFATRGAGHNPNVGFASIDNSGVLIDLHRLTSLQISSDHKTVSAGPGNHWIDIYEYLDPFQLTAIGGRSPQVGISGLLLGSGLPYIAGLYGLACDNVEEYEIVLGDSRIVKASINNNADLYQALKGGGPNFGIVTNFNLYTRPLRNIWFALLNYAESDRAALLKATAQVQQLMESDPKAGLVLNSSPGSTLMALFYADYVDWPAPYAPLKNLTALQTLVAPTNGTLLQLSRNLEAFQAPQYHQPISVASQVDADLYMKLYQDYLNHRNYSTDPSSIMTWSIQPIGKLVVEAGQRTGGNILGIPAQPQSWLNSLANWNSTAETQPARSAVQSVLTDMTSTAKAAKKFLPILFQNDAASFQNVLGSYGRDNLAKLKAVSRKYDGFQVFQKLQNGGFKVSEAS